MDTQSALLQALHANPADEVAWLALADHLEEQGQSRRAELLRLHRSLPGLPEGAEKVARTLRVQQLLEAGVRPTGPRLLNSVGMEFALVPAGRFLMGAPAEEDESYPDEYPVHEVEISTPFYFAITQVTQAEFAAVLGYNPSHHAQAAEDEADSSHQPVECVSWLNAVGFCDDLSCRPEELQAGRRYRLPTEAEWEYACRAWSPNPLPFHHGFSLDYRHAWFDWERVYGPDATPRSPIPLCPGTVAMFPPNAFGLFDMHGNVDEWCSDYYGRSSYQHTEQRDPTGLESGDEHVVRGGSWFDDGHFCRAAVRIGYAAEEAEATIGFRVVCVWNPGQQVSA